jgi:Pyruvate/2-oxoacid:ferredoxin oxidoreductase delta subunit
MYLVAKIDPEICGSKSCTLCTMYCPEADTILYDKKRKTAYVSVDRCKGCMQCVWVCDNMAKNHAIKMEMIDQLPEEFSVLTTQVTYDTSHLKTVSS